MAIKKILLTVFFFILQNTIYANTSYFKQLSVQNGLSQVNVISIYQDETGALWFGTFEGINRYNGQSFTVFHASQDNSGLAHNEIMNICGNKKGHIYIQALHDLICYDTRTQQFQKLRADGVSNIYYRNDTLWIAGRNKVEYRIEGDTTIHTLVTFKECIKSSSALCATDNGHVYVGLNEGVLKISTTQPKQQQVLLPSIKVQSIYQDSKKNVWIGTATNGAYRLAPDGSILNFCNTNSNSISNNDVRCIIEDDFENLWFGTFYGLNKFDPTTQTWENHVHQNNTSHSLSHSSIFALHKDTQGGIWIGTYFGGVNYYNPINDYSNYYEANPDMANALSFPVVGKIQEDNKQNLWICTEGGGLNFFDRKTKQFTRYAHNNEISSSIGHNNLKCLWFREETEQLYLGTHTGGLTIFDTRSRLARTLKNIPNKANSIPNNVVNGLQYYKGRLILATQAGIKAMNLETETFEPLSNKQNIREIVENYVYVTFHIDRNDHIWLASGNGGLTRMNLRTGKKTNYRYDSAKRQNIGRFKVIHIFENHKNELFFSTAGSGLFKYEPQTDSFFCFSRENNLLMNNYCYYVAESSAHELFVLHNRGVSCLNTDKKELTYTHLIPHMSFGQGSSIFFTHNGEMCLGGNNGMAALKEAQVAPIFNYHQFYFDQLIINNKEIQPGDESRILSQTMPYTDAIALTHYQNSLILEVATSNYIQNKYKYEYRLEGFEQAWIPLYSSKIVYTNLDPGRYKLTIREKDDSQTVSGERTLSILIRPPFYANIYAYVLYILVVCFILYAIIRFNNRQAKLKASLELERKEKEKINELNQVKLRFFTNISHEFRTPLTLIIGQIETLLQLDKLTPAIYNRLLRVYKNANHMRTLISELLDFRKQEQGYLKLKVECRDVVAFAKDIHMSFYEYALKKHISFRFEASEQSINAWFDPMQMQKVIINLLSNAFKYTPAEGNITVAIRTHLQQVMIQIKDTGTGIPQESIHRIFDRFYQIDEQASKFSLGTGIGLALSKSIVELHKGEIKVESEVKEGSCFTVVLKMGNSHFETDELLTENNPTCIVINTDLIPLEEQPMEEETKNEFAEKPVILLVEDNEDILEMLKEIFDPVYEIHTAKDGKEGFEQTLKIQPDIVLSDVMMPEMSGKEMCYKIKNTVNLSHIPIVLLTAQTSIEYTIEGYMYGADDYITKPFNVKLLVSRCNNLVKNRKILIEKFKNQQEIPLIGNATNQADQELIGKTTAIISKNFENQEFNMNALAVELGLGRNKLYTRIKEITGLTPNEFTLKLKLDESMRLLKNNPELNISEISDRLGFSSTQYFSKCFKSVFGMPPLTFRKSNSITTDCTS